MAKQDMDVLENIKITVLSEKGFYDSELFLKELKACGGMDAKHEYLHIHRGRTAVRRRGCLRSETQRGELRGAGTDVARTGRSSRRFEYRVADSK